MENIYNKMMGSGFIVPTDIVELDSEVMLGKTEYIDAEVSVRIIRKNRMPGRVRILKMVPDSVVIDGDIEDTYVRESLPYMSFKDSNVLKSGTLDNENFFGMMRFNNVTDILTKTGPQFLTLKLVLKPVDRNIQNIELYELDNSFKAYNVSYQNHPQISEKIGDMQYDAFKNEYYIDLTQYSKQIIDGVRDHNGFTFASDGIVNIYSSESSYGKPKLVMEYIDPNKFQSENEIPAEIDFLESIGLNVELNLENPYPVLDSELTFSQDSIAANVLLAETIGLDAEIKLAPTIGEKATNSELKFSKDAVLAEIRFNESVGLESEVEYIPPDESILNSEVDIMMFSARPAVVNLAFPGKSECDAELKCYDYDKSTLDSEVTLSNIFGASINSCVSLYTKSELDSEMKLFVKDRNDSLDVELEFTKNMMPAKVRFSPSERLDAEVTLVIEDKLDAEVDFEIFGYLDACVNLYVEKTLNSEINLAIPGTSELDSEIGYITTSRLDACVSLYTENKLNSEIDLRFKSDLNACVNLFDKSELNSCVSLFTSEHIDCEMRLALIGLSSIESEVKFLIASNLDAEFILLKIEESYLNAALIFGDVEEEYLDSEVVLFKTVDTSIDASVIFLDIEELQLNSEVVLFKTVDTSIDASIVYLAIEEKYIDVELDLVKKIKAKITVIER